MKTLLRDYRKNKPKLKQRIRDFKRKGTAAEKEIFSELCFCLLTPQSSAVNCDSAIQELKNAGLLFKGCAGPISKVLKSKVRFHNNKSAYIVAARKYAGIKRLIEKDDIPATRDWLANNIKGLGYKEASHFLRNIGLGRDIAILDRHILKNLARYGVIGEIPKTLGRKAYLAIEGKMRGFSKKLNIPMDELDLLFWSRETGHIFK